MYIVIYCPYSHEHEDSTKIPKFLATCMELDAAVHVIQDFLKMQIHWEFQSERLHTTIVYGGIGFFMIVKDGE